MIYLGISGAIDGVNNTFTLSAQPNVLELYRNGFLQAPGTDYTLSGVTVTFAPSFVPQPGDVLLAVTDFVIVLPVPTPPPQPATGYTEITLAQFVQYIGELMDDPGNVYWPPQQVILATYEALLVWGAETAYWRDRGTFSIRPSDPSPYYDLSVVLPTLRTRSWTLGLMVLDIQYMLEEPAVGITGTGMTGQTDVQTILAAIQLSRDRFVMDANIPYTYHSVFGGLSPTLGLLSFPQASVYVHRAAWQDQQSQIWRNLWRSDAWALDRGFPQWTTNPGYPRYYSEAELAPLVMQLIPPPVASGQIEAITVDSLLMNLNDANQGFGVPDEWVHAIKYATLSYLLAGEGMIKDSMRAEYAEQRYQQAVDLIKDDQFQLRYMVNNIPLNMDALFNIDAGYPRWRNQSGKPFLGGVLFDFFVPVPGIPDQIYGITADVAKTAPLPQLNDFINLGREEMDHLTDYVSHILTFKCGGDEFQSTMKTYDSYMRAVARRKAINTAKIRYLTPIFDQPTREWNLRPDQKEPAHA